MVEETNQSAEGTKSDGNTQDDHCQAELGATPITEPAKEPFVNSGGPQWRLTHTLKGHSKSISTVSFSPDGTKLASSSADGTLLVWKIIPGDTLGRPAYVELLIKLFGSDSSDGINDVAWSPDSKHLVSASDDHLIRTWSLAQTTPTRKLAGHSHCVYCVKLNPIGTVLISGSFDETIKVWDFVGGKLLRTLPGHSEVVSCLDFSRDGSVIVSGSFDGLIRLWDTTSGQCLKTLVVAQETNAPVSFVAFTPNSYHLLTCSLDSTVRLWDYKTKEGTVVKSYVGHTNVKFSIPARVISIDKQLGKRGEYVLMGSEDGIVWIWDLQSRKCMSKISSHQDSIIGLAVHPFDHSLIVTAGLEKDSVIRIFGLAPAP